MVSNNNTPEATMSQPLNASIPASKAQDMGEAVTTKSESGGIGTGRLIGAYVYVSGGNGFYHVDTDVVAILLDDGKGYMEAMRALSTKVLDGREWHEVARTCAGYPTGRFCGR